MDKTKGLMNRTVNRRSLMQKGVLAAGAATMGAALLGGAKAAFGDEDDGRLRRGDAAILRFLAAAEILETDLWVQYAELGGIGDNPPIEIDPNQAMNNYQIALSNLDGDGPQYITSNTLDEASHAAFLNAYLESKGAEPVNLEQFRTLPGSTASGSSGKKRLTNLMHLNVDTGWFVRYRSTTNPDLGGTFPQAIKLNNVTAIPRTTMITTAPPTQLSATTYSSDRQRRGLSLRHDRTGWLQPLFRARPESQQPRSAENYAGNWRRRSRALPGMGGFCGQRSATARRAVHRLHFRPHLSRLFQRSAAAPANWCSPA